MEAIRFIVGTLLQVLLVMVFLLRVLLPLVRADSRNQLSQAVIRLTNPLVLPLRRVLPPIGKVDTASIVALIIVQAAAVAMLWLLGGYPGIFTPAQFLYVVVMTLITTVPFPSRAWSWTSFTTIPPVFGNVIFFTSVWESGLRNSTS